MWNQIYQNEYDDWDYQGSDNQYYSRDSRDNWTNDSVNYCSRCGAPVNTRAHSHYSRRRYNEDKRRYDQTHQNRSSHSSVLVPIAVMIAVIVIIASCNVGRSSASSGLATGQDINIVLPESENAVYQVSEPISLAEIKFQGSNQPFESTPRTYVVKPGDTLYRIAVEMLGDGSRWTEIDQLNNLRRLSNGSVLIHPGQVLILPDQ